MDQKQISVSTPAVKVLKNAVGQTRKCYFKFHFSFQTGREVTSIPIPQFCNPFLNPAEHSSVCMFHSTLFFFQIHLNNRLWSFIFQSSMEPCLALCPQIGTYSLSSKNLVNYSSNILGSFLFSALQETCLGMKFN